MNTIDIKSLLIEYQQIQLKLKNLQEQENTLKDKIIDYMKKNNHHKIKYKNCNLKLITNKSKEPITLKYLTQSLQQYDPQNYVSILNFINTNRTYKTHQSLKCYTE